MNSKDRKTIIILLIIVALIVVIPFAIGMMQGAEFGGSDDAGGTLVEQTDSSYQAWATPLLEQAIGGELPGEIESLLFCLQTGIGVGIVAFFIGRLYERKKLGKDDEEL